MEKKSKIERLKTQMSKIYGERLDFDHWEELEYSVIDEIGLKLNEIIDYLNSQAQAEVLPVEGDEFEYNGEKYKWGKTYTSKDTPEEKEEWEKRFIRTFGYWGEEIKFIKQLLDEREREVLERLLEKRSRLPFTENWLVWVTHITRELNKLDGKKQ